MKAYILTLFMAFSCSVWAERMFFETDPDSIFNTYGNVSEIYENNSSIYNEDTFSIYGDHEDSFYREYARRFGHTQPTEEPSTPYTPFPWPCDEFQQDCADSLEIW